MPEVNSQKECLFMIQTTELAIFTVKIILLKSLKCFLHYQHRKPS